MRRTDEEKLKPIVFRLSAEDPGEHVEAFREDVRSEGNRLVCPLDEAMLALEGRV